MNENIVHRDERDWEVDRTTDRAQEVWADVQAAKLSVKADIEYKHSADDIAEPVAPDEAIVHQIKLTEVYESLEQLRTEMSYLNIQCDLMMPVQSDTMHYSECEFARKIALVITEKLDRTIATGAYINHRPTE